MGKIVKRQLILLGAEPSYKGAVTLDGTNALQVSNLSVKETKTMLERPPIIASRAPLQKLPGNEFVEVSFDVELKGSGTAGTAPPHGDVLECCGLAGTVVAATSVTYAYNADHELDASARIVYWEDGTANTIVGARGSWAIAITGTEFPKLTFTGSGHKLSRADGTQIAPIFSTQKPAAPLGIPLTIGAFSPAWSSVTLSGNHTLAKPIDITQTDGYGEFVITDTPMTVEILVNAEDVATKDYFGDWDAGTPRAVTIGPWGTAGNIVQIDLPAITIDDISRSDEEGLLKYTLVTSANESALGAADQISILHT